MRLSAVYTPLDRSTSTLWPFLTSGALSYVWGQDRPRRKINLNGVIIIIRENLYQALRILQASNFEFPDGEHPNFEFSTTRASHTYFWIDAICINQDDPLERGHQVGLMKEIFSGAACVVSWLGADFQNSSWAMERVHSDAMDYDTRNILTPFEVLDHLDYWRRMWIIQEFALARYVLLVSSSMATWWTPASRPHGRNSMERLYRLRKQLWELNNTRFPVPFGVASETVTRFSLMELLQTFSYPHCTDARDRVYALLSLVQETQGEDRGPALHADYTITAEHLYYQVLRYCRRDPNFTLQDFRADLANALGVRRDGKFWRRDIVYAATEGSGLPEDLENGLVYNTALRKAWTDSFLEFLSVPDHIGKRISHIRGTDEKRRAAGHKITLMATTGSTEERHRMCHTVLQDYHDFPEREDPTTWSCFETLLRALLGLLGTDYNVLPKTTGPIIARPPSAAVYVRNVLQDLKSQRSLWSL